MIEESVFASQDNFIVTFATLNYQTFVHFNANLSLHLFFDLYKCTFVHDCDVKLSQHAVWVVRVIPTEHGLVVIDLFIGLGEEMIKSVALDGGCTTHRLGDIVAEPVLVGLKGLTL